MQLRPLPDHELIILSLRVLSKFTKLAPANLQSQRARQKLLTEVFDALYYLLASSQSAVDSYFMLITAEFSIPSMIEAALPLKSI
jgi:hypothetical protein